MTSGRQEQSRRNWTKLGFEGRQRVKMRSMMAGTEAAYLEVKELSFLL